MATQMSNMLVTFEKVLQSNIFADIFKTGVGISKQHLTDVSFSETKVEKFVDELSD